MQFSSTVANARADLIESTVGTSALLSIWSGTIPANCATANAGTQLALINLPSDWMANASNGTKMLSGTWSTTVSSTGTAAYFRIHDSSGTACHVQGTVGTLGANDMILSSTSLTASSLLNITAFTFVENNFP